MLKSLYLLFLLVIGAQLTRGQYPESVAFKILTVEQGLPQSFVSGLVQDSTGFIWVGTRDGLARYDGKKFKLFMHQQGDTRTLANNIIQSLYLDKSNRLWIVYETGDIDLLDTRTEILTHISQSRIYKDLTGNIKIGHSISEDKRGNIFLLRKGGGMFRINLNSRKLEFFSEADLGMKGNMIVGISARNGNIVLVADTSFIELNDDLQIVKSICYRFDNPRLFNPTAKWKDSYPLFRKNGEVIIQDEGRLIVYLPETNSFKIVDLPGERHWLSMNTIIDQNEQVLIAYNVHTYVLNAANQLQLWKPRATSPEYGFKSMLIDRSGVLWLGGNGSGIQLHNLRPSGFEGFNYKKNFHEDLLSDFLHVPKGEMARSFLSQENSFYFRWLHTDEGGYWFSWGSSDQTPSPQVNYYKNGHLTQMLWQYSDSSVPYYNHVGAMAKTKSGKIWGVDFFLRPILFDTLSWTATVYPSIGQINTNNTYSISHMLIDGEEDFWISTSFDGLIHYNKQTGVKERFLAEDRIGSLPTNQLMNMAQDPADKDLLWIGSLGGGLISFNKRTKLCRSYTIRNGLPNNTVYAVMFDADGLLWCSSNRGVFSFDRLKHSTNIYTSKDGLPGDEFNRYQYFQFTDGRLAFGGVNGYVVFNPSKLVKDTFQPTIALTGISVNNKPVDYGESFSMYRQSSNSLDTIVLNYSQNFLSFEMAALQFNITEKLQYRYRLNGFDHDWIETGNSNSIVYTNIPPGRYELFLNATNTAGRWSKHIKKLSIIIKPPFWRTTWFALLMALLLGALIYFFIKFRIGFVRKEEQQKAQFEREATELRAQALRAQMNPHFIFNCLNSIKSLIQEEEPRKAVQYLTSFSKLIRSQLNNSQQEVSLGSELATCKLYVQLESLRFGSRIVCEFHVPEYIDVFSVQVPPLILQPFIENAIWHGILPNNGGRVTLSVTDENDFIVCKVDDDGIGREMAVRNKSKTNSTYESKGMKLVKNRLEIFNAINNRGGDIEVVDKLNRDGNAAGTLVIIRFKKEL